MHLNPKITLSSWPFSYTMLLICLEPFLPVQCNSNVEWLSVTNMRIWTLKILMIWHTPIILLLFVSVHWVLTRSQHRELEMRYQKQFFLVEVLLSVKREKTSLLSSNTEGVLYKEVNNKEDTESVASPSSWECVEKWIIRGEVTLKYLTSNDPSLPPLSATSITLPLIVCLENEKKKKTAF